MSASQKPEAAGGDPSMEDILASIRRILSEDEQAARAEAGPSPPPARIEPEYHKDSNDDDDVLVLDPSMMVPEPAAIPPLPEPRAVSPIELSEPLAPVVPVEPVLVERVAESGLVGPEAARATAASLAGLIATLANERGTQVHAGGPTLEDLVRAVLRPLLKDWLDTHLPVLVERLVRTEIERVVGRATS